MLPSVKLYLNASKVEFVLGRATINWRPYQQGIKPASNWRTAGLVLHHPN